MCGEGKTMKLYVFRNEPGTGYMFCTQQPTPIYKDDMRGVVYTDYGELLGCIPTVTFEHLFPMLKFEGGSYRQVRLEAETDDLLGITGYVLTQIYEDKDETEV